MSDATLDGADHLGDVASAYLDGELDADARARVEAHLTGCPACERAVAAEATVRRAVRALGPVAVPEGFFEGLLAAGADDDVVDLGTERRRRRVRVGLAQLAATAAVWVVVLAGLTDGLGGSGVVPEVPGYLRAHVAEASVLGTSTTPAVPDVAAATRSQLPATVASQRLVKVRRMGDVVQAVYHDGDTVVSVFVQPGVLDVASLPAEARRVDVGGGPGYRITRRDAVVLVVPRGDAVYTVVAPPAARTGALPEELPARSAPSPSVLDRVKSAGRGLVDCFGLAG